MDGLDTEFVQFLGRFCSEQEYLPADASVKFNFVDMFFESKSKRVR
jgi:hypothetical protein